MQRLQRIDCLVGREEGYIKRDKTKGDVTWKIVSLPRIESILEQQTARSSLKELQIPHSNTTSISGREIVDLM